MKRNSGDEEAGARASDENKNKPDTAAAPIRVRIGTPAQAAVSVPKSFLESIKRGINVVKDKLNAFNTWVRSDASVAEKAPTAFRTLVGASFVWFGTALKFAAFYSAAALLLPGSLVAAPLLAAAATRWLPMRAAVPFAIIGGFATGFGLAVRAALALVIPYALMVKDETIDASEEIAGTVVNAERERETLRVGSVTVVEEELDVTAAAAIVEKHFKKPKFPEIAYAYEAGVSAADSFMNLTSSARNRASEAYAEVSQRRLQIRRPAQSA